MKEIESEKENRGTETDIAHEKIRKRKKNTKIDIDRQRESEREIKKDKGREII